MKILTVILGLLALATGVLAYRSGPSDASTPFGKEGTLIGKAAEPKDVAKISVATWDEQVGKARLFQVQKKGEGWIIPSVFSYPADAGDRVGRTAGVLNVKRGRFVSDDAQRHDELGVIDPTSAQAEKAKTRGKRVTIEDAGGAKLIDLIVASAALGERDVRIDAALAELSHRPGKLLQPPGQLPKHHQPDTQPDAQTCQHRRPGEAHAQIVLEQLFDPFVFLAAQYHVQIALTNLGGRDRRRGKDFTPVVTARVVAQQGKTPPGEKLTHRSEIDIAALHLTRLRGIRQDGAGGVQQINLDARVDHHVVMERLP